MLPADRVRRRHEHLCLGLRLEREVFARLAALKGNDDEQTIGAANNLSATLTMANLHEEAVSFGREQLPIARRALGPDHIHSVRLAANLSSNILTNPKCSRDEALEAQALIEDTLERKRRVFGRAHPTTQKSETQLAQVTMLLAFGRRYT